MNVLMEICLALFVVAILMSPMVRLASSNLDRAAFSSRRSQSYNLARSMVNRFEGNGLTSLYVTGREDDERQIVVENPHLHDPLIAAIVPTELRSEQHEVTTTVRLQEQGRGIALLHATVVVTRGSGSHTSEAMRLVRTAW